MKKFLNFIYLPIIIINLVISSLVCYSSFINKLPYKPSTLNSMDYCIVREYQSNADIKQDIDDLFNNPKYILKYKEMSGDTAGYTVLLLKIVVLDNDLTQENYTLTLAHELVHLTHFTANERYVSFITFKVLYESDNKYFKSVALAYADAQFKHLYPRCYDCSGYIEEYITNIEID